MPISDEYWNLGCTQHKACKVQLRVILVTPPFSPAYKVNVFRNSANHSGVLRTDPDSGYKTVKVSDHKKEKMIEALEAAYLKLTPSQLYQRFLAPKDVRGPLPETQSMMSERQKLKRYCENLKRNHQKKVRALCLDTVKDLVRETSGNVWTSEMWSEARAILESGNNLQPAMIRLNHLVVEDGFAVCFTCSASAVSAFNLQNKTKQHTGITLYADGFASAIRGCSSQFLIIGVASIELNGDGHSVASLIPLVVSLVDAESEDSVAVCFEAAKQLIESTGDGAITALCCDSAPGLIKGAQRALGNVFIHRCKWHRSESLRKTQMTEEERQESVIIAEALCRCSDDHAYRGILNSVQCNAKLTSRVKSYFSSSGRVDIYGAPYIKNQHNSRLLNIAYDNNICESFNGLLKRGSLGGQRLNTGIEVVLVLRTGSLRDVNLQVKRFLEDICLSLDSIQWIV